MDGTSQSESIVVNEDLQLSIASFRNYHALGCAWFMLLVEDYFSHGSFGRIVKYFKLHLKKIQLSSVMDCAVDTLPVPVSCVPPRYTMKVAG